MKICLVGNQNSGKTTLFNELTGMNLKIGNWPGVTVQKKIGIIKETNLEIVDLPGIYSLNPYTEEEKVSINYILYEKPYIIINIVDATCLERSLYLTTQLLELTSKVIIVLNMTDLLTKRGIKIDILKLQNELQTNICEVSALKKTGINNLIQTIKNEAISNHRTKINSKISNKCKNCIQNCSKKNYEQMAIERYNYISKITSKCLYRKKKWITKTEMLDKIFLSKTLSIPIFIVIMFGIYFLSVGVVGKLTSEGVEKILNIILSIIKNVLDSIKTPQVIQSLIINGIFKGVSTVLSFIPQLTILFTCISILETSGYMSRIAFLLDNIFRKIGLSGKALIPLIVGSGCSVPGIMSTKIIENEDERKITSILVPFIPCSAKLPIIALFTSYFFKENAGTISALIYFLAILIIILSSLVLKRFIFTNTEGAFISELPDYKIPSIKYVTRDVLDKTIGFIKRAGTIILLASIVIWCLISFSTRLEYGINIEDSILATIGKKISWIFYPIIGKNSWELTVSALQGLIAKEQIIASMSIISGAEGGNMFDNNATFGFMTKWSAISFTIFNLFSAPCFAAIATMRKELGGICQSLLAIIYQTIIAWCLATLIFLAEKIIY